MADQSFYHAEGDQQHLVWLEHSSFDARAYCDKHRVPLVVQQLAFNDNIHCPFDGETFTLRNRYNDHRRFIEALMRRDAVKNLKVVRIDAEGQSVLAKERDDLDDTYWVEAKLSKSAQGVQLMVQAGKKDGDNKKVQLFVDAPRERLGFDSSMKDIHPAGLFSKVTAIFKDSATIMSDRKIDE